MQAVGSLFDFLGQGDASLWSKLDAATTFIKAMVLQLHPDKEAAAGVAAAIDAVVKSEKQSATLVREMEEIAEKIDAGVTREEEKKLRRRMQQLKEALKDINKQGAAEAFEAYGVRVRDPVPNTFETSIERIVSDYVESMVERFAPYM
ncbi:hypothetical protein, conserved [Eimeria brunetti]|uniref:DnaJ domain-containing protein n=1 Tax=Eimeria brunetti TaxID=51314 RepID=U6LS17_9EIME|nr:hypothetical protein, conserved [Eimeria brunetti]